MNGGARQGSGAASGPHLWFQARPAQRLLVQGVLALTAQLVRGIAEGLDAPAMRALVGERQRLLRELGRGIRSRSDLGCYEAMQTAVDESDAAIAVMLDDEAAIPG